jgi:hypothetical protein
MSSSVSWRGIKAADDTSKLKISPWTNANQVLKGNVLIAMLEPKIRELVQ